jgi:hypothetical protein
VPIKILLKWNINGVAQIGLSNKLTGAQKEHCNHLRIYGQPDFRQKKTLGINLGF